MNRPSSSVRVRAQVEPDPAGNTAVIGQPDASPIEKAMWPTRWWWVMLSAILLCAGVLRYTGYNFSLPYVENPEEARLTFLARDISLTGQIAPEDTSAPYPIGLIALHYGLLSWFYAPHQLPSTVLLAVRLISITVGLASLVLIALLGYRIATPQAGLVAAALWAVVPAAIQVSRSGAADSFVAFWLLLALFLVLSGTLYHHGSWILWGSVALILAALFSYQAVLLFPLLLAIPLWRLHDSRTECRSAVIRNLGDQVFVITLFVIWLLWLSPLVVSVKLEHWGAAFRSLTLPLLVQNLRLPIVESSQSPVWVVGLVGMGWLAWPPFRRETKMFGLVTLVTSAVAWSLVVSADYVQDFQHLMLIGALLAVLCGVGLAGWIRATQWAVEHMAGRLRGSAPGCIGGAAGIMLAIIGSIPQIGTSVADALQHALPDRRNDLAVWADTTLEGGLHIADPADDRVLNALLGGYQGLSMFPLAETALVTDRPLAEWRSRGAIYAISPYADYQALQTTPDGLALLGQMVLLKSYPPSKSYRDPGMVVFRLYPIKYPVEASLGSIHLIGYDIDHTEVFPGETLMIRYYWQAKQPTERAMRVFNHLDPLDSINPVTQIDGPPVVDLRRPTTLWTDPTETVVSQVFVLNIDPEVAPGKYRLLTGFYDPDTGQRLLSPSGESFILLTTMKVKNR